MDKLLITGASGFIGQALVKRLHEKYEIHATYESQGSFIKNPELNHKGQQHVMDLTIPGNIGGVLDRVQPDKVIHLAAKSEVAHSFENFHEVQLVNYVGTVLLAEGCRKLWGEDAWRHHNRFIFASTMETYGGASTRWEGPVNELTDQEPQAPYAIAKVAAEKYLTYLRDIHDLPVIVLRQSNTYGRSDNDFFVMERIITQMLHGDVVNLGAAYPYRNFLYIDDLVDLYEIVLENEEAVFNTFVTGPDNALTIDDLVLKIKEILGWDGVVNWNTIPKRPGEVFYLNSYGGKAKQMLGWEPKVDLDEGIRRTIEMWK